MIYMNIVQTNQPMQTIDTQGRDLTFFKDYEPQKLKYPTSEAHEKAIKTQQMKIIIAGTMTGDLKRNNTNVFSRSLLFIDFDDIQETEADFLQKIEETLKGVNRCLYPTLKYKPDNIRYRLVVELDREVNASEYEKLLFGVSHELGVKFTFDTSNRTWSQGQAAPVMTEYSKEVKRLYYDDLEPIPVDAFLHRINQSKEFKNAQKEQKRPFNRLPHQISASGQKYTGQFLEKLFNGQAEGNRNNWWREVLDSMLNVGTPVSTIEKAMLCLNGDATIFPQPLETKELETIFLSRVNNHVKNGGELY